MSQLSTSYDSFRYSQTSFLRKVYNLINEGIGLAEGVEESVIKIAASNATKKNADYVCDGTNDEEIIETAISELPSSGGTIKLSDGLFTTLPWEFNKANVTIEGQGDATKIFFPDNCMNGYDGPAQLRIRGNSTNSRIKNLKIDGNQENQGEGETYCIYCEGLAHNILFENLHIVNPYGDGFNLTQNSKAVNNIIENAKEDAIEVVSGGGQIVHGNTLIDNFNSIKLGVSSTDIIEDVIISNNYITGEKASAITLRVYSGSGIIRRVNIDNNIIVNSVDSGIWLRPYESGIINNISIRGNILSECGRITGQGASIYLNGVTSSQISDNQILNSNSHGIYVYNTNKCSISDNIVSDSDYNGLQVAGNLIHINGNEIFNNQQEGISGSGLGDNIQILNNRIYDNNLADNGHNGIISYLTDGTLKNWVIKDNQIFSTTTQLQSKGIYITTNARTINQLIVKDNLLEGNTTNISITALGDNHDTNTNMSA